MIELMVVVAIIGILATTGFQLYSTWVKRAYGSEAALTLKRILDGQIGYILENEDFFPEPGRTIFISKNHSPSDPEIEEIKNALKITIPVGHSLDFTITHGINPDNTTFCLIEIWADFPLFKTGENYIRATMDKEGTINYF